MHFIRDSLGVGFVALVLAGCSEQAPTPVSTEADSPPVDSTCGDAGYLRATLTGALNAELEWTDTALRCESMRRPDDRGVRLRFSGRVGGERLAIIISMPELDPGETGAEFDSVITLTVEGSGRFFTTPNLGTCWTDIGENSPDKEDGGPYVVAGSLTCVGPLGEFNGDAYVDIRDLRFSGIGDWGAT
ncbi:MAG: hypothetical protein QNJ11_13150 [Woeseiaceae bacterium]|nr:hypothetical protein [Woeseiaceae bacterium]